jgi:hypothetical protein
MESAPLGERWLALCLSLSGFSLFLCLTILVFSLTWSRRDLITPSPPLPAFPSLPFSHLPSFPPPGAPAEASVDYFRGTVRFCTAVNACI